jgi:hypothetical protein
MGRWFKRIGLGLIVVLVVLQFFRPDRNATPVDPQQDLLSVASPPDQVASLIRSSCYDCHSNQTNYPWYSNISPVSWYLNQHISKGKEEVNFSEYGSLEKADKIRVLDEFYEVLEGGDMPLPSYTLIHREARLSKEEIDALCSWSEQEALRVMRE